MLVDHGRFFGNRRSPRAAIGGAYLILSGRNVVALEGVARDCAAADR